MKLSNDDLRLARDEHRLYVERLGSKGKREHVETVENAATWARAYGGPLLDLIAELQSENDALRGRT